MTLQICFKKLSLYNVNHHIDNKVIRVEQNCNFCRTRTRNFLLLLLLIAFSIFDLWFGWIRWPERWDYFARKPVWGYKEKRTHTNWNYLNILTWPERCDLGFLKLALYWFSGLAGYTNFQSFIEPLTVTQSIICFIHGKLGIFRLSPQQKWVACISLFLFPYFLYFVFYNTFHFTSYLQTKFLQNISANLIIIYKTLGQNEKTVYSWLMYSLNIP